MHTFSSIGLFFFGGLGMISLCWVMGLPELFDMYRVARQISAGLAPSCKSLFSAFSPHYQAVFPIFSVPCWQDKIA
jgi:hypothetical protein